MWFLIASGISDILVFSLAFFLGHLVVLPIPPLSDA